MEIPARPPKSVKLNRLLNSGPHHFDIDIEMSKDMIDFFVDNFPRRGNRGMGQGGLFGPGGGGPGGPRDFGHTP
jgi:hypothetical protein